MVTAFSPGDATLRLMVGFGTGRGSLIYTATCVAPDGTVLAQLDGQERFIGTEVWFNQEYGAFTTLGGEDTVTTVLVKEADKHVVELVAPK